MMSDELDLPKWPLTHPNEASMEGWVRYASDRWVINKHRPTSSLTAPVLLTTKTAATSRHREGRTRNDLGITGRSDVTAPN